MTPRVLGLDIGGANLKAAHSDGGAISQPFALWKNPAELPSALAILLQALPAFDLVAVTMTGELCDCFETKRQGVNVILDAVEAVAAGVPVRVWQTNGAFVNCATARVVHLQTAASNWLALATYAGRFAPEGPGLLVDIGSTTTDLVPLLDGRPLPRGRTDRERLRCHELVYTGVSRTPVCALLGRQGAAELFATTRDVYLLLGWLPPEPADHTTADGRPATRSAAHARLARMVCADIENFDEAEAEKLAHLICELQLALLDDALHMVMHSLPEPPRALVLSGSGEFLTRRLLARHPVLTSRPVISLHERLGTDVSAAACAHALAVLAAEHFQAGV